MNAALTPERWRRAKEIFESARNLPPQERREYVRTNSGADESLAHEVNEMLDADLAEDSFLDRSPLLAAHADPLEHRMVGAYRLIRRIGRGGMAAVYLAERADDQFRKCVAIKLIEPSAEDTQVSSRFENERQTLAVLDHPCIVRLLDGGTTSDGFAYIVMDYVEGRRIDEYCEAQNLGLRGVLELFCRVCEAVQYAHQNLIVHRDIKPANILVTGDGMPKLLDFGISKLLRPEYGSSPMGLTRTAFQPMTPEYASPEQILGRHITTATDIYSLGVVLYRLLAGKLPFEFGGHTASDIERFVCETEPQAPSKAARSNRAKLMPGALAGAIKGDLDRIVLKALRKEPGSRYASAQQFSEDIHRYLNGLPVSARKPTVAYRTTRFVTRHRAGVAAVGIAVIALLVGTVASIRGIYVARAAQARAEHRFTDLRNLARFVLFELNDAVRAGPTEARRLMVTRALQYLNSLAAEAAGDRSLQLELVNGYIVVGDVQGNLYGPNSGDATGAMQSYQNALRIASELRKAAPGDADAQSAAARANIAVADVLATDGDRTQALAMYREAQAIIQAGESPQKILQLARLAPKIALTEMKLGDAAAALASYRTALSLAEQSAAAHPLDVKLRHALAYGKERVGVVLAMTGEHAAAERNLREALLLYQQLSALGTGGERDVADTHLELGDVLKAQGRNVQAFSEYGDGLRICEKIAADDTSNVQSRRNVHIALGRLADLSLAMKRHAEARRYTVRALRVLRPMVTAPTPSPYDLQQLAWLLLTTPFSELQDPEAASNAAAQAVTLTNRSDPAILNILAMAHFASGDGRRAAAIAEEALRRLPAGKSAMRDEIEANVIRFQASGSRTLPPPPRQ